ncbi:MAG: SDR family oxidoreductase [Bacteroidales bacterium]|nr:SDR family oxidoreductase [Bacteroidales bacterium]
MKQKYWAFILGGSSGMGLASAKALAQKGYNLLIAHRDGRIGTKAFQDDLSLWKPSNVDVITVNANANTSEGKEQIKQAIRQLPEHSIKIFLHSVADGHIKPLFDQEIFLSEEDLLYTVNSMGLSFVTWSQWLFQNHFFATKAKIFGFTSEGSRRVIPHYAAVGTAKAVLETMCKYMAYELAPHQISVNLLCPGVVNTKAIRVFPNTADFIEQITEKNPYKRLTTPEDVANVLVALSSDETNWLNGETIHIDGGESNVF